LGDGTNTNKNSPIQIGTSTNWQSISADGWHTIGIKADSTLWTWGFNGFGQLGNGANLSINTPTQIGITTNWQSISAGFFHTLAIKTDGTLWAAGENNYGQLGDGTTINKNVPTLITPSCFTPNNVIDLSTAENTIIIYPNPAHSSVAIKLDQIQKGNVNIKLTDMVGRTIQELKTVAISSALNIEMNLSSTSKGTYMVEIRNNDKLINSQFLVVNQ
jgi:alpha-tubulin suppressor-like RCC1 family protein